MKKAIAILSVTVICLSLFACTKKEGDLGKQTSIDKSNGYTLVQEVLTFKYSKEEDEIDKNDLRTTVADGQYTAIQTKSDALELAKKEVTAQYNKINIYFDRTQGVWKIVFSTDAEVTDANSNKIVSNNITETVYVDEDGYIIADVKN